MKKLTIKSLWSKFNPFASYSMSPTLVIIYILMAIFFAIKNPIFIDLKNYQVIAINAPILGIVAIGLAAVILTGNVDLSVGSLVGFISVFSALMLKNSGMPATAVIIIGLLAGIAIGAFNGFVVNYIGVNSIIVTLGMWATLRGASMIITGGVVYFKNEKFVEIGRGYVFKVIPNIFLFMMVILAVMYFVLRFTKFGRNIYLVGANFLSATAVGVNVKKTKFLTFLISSGFAALAGILLVSQFSSAHYDYGTGWEFRALTICIVGGISLSGGRGTLVGLFLALLILGSMSNGLTLINMPNYWRSFFDGSVLLLAIIVDSLRVRRMSYST